MGAGKRVVWCQGYLLACVQLTRLNAGSIELSCGGVAQRIEQGFSKPLVGGSIPSAPAIGCCGGCRVGLYVNLKAI